MVISPRTSSELENSQPTVTNNKPQKMPSSNWSGCQSPTTGFAKCSSYSLLPLHRPMTLGTSSITDWAHLLAGTRTAFQQQVDGSVSCEAPSRPVQLAYLLLAASSKVPHEVLLEESSERPSAPKLLPTPKSQLLQPRMELVPPKQNASYGGKSPTIVPDLA